MDLKRYIDNRVQGNFLSGDKRPIYGIGYDNVLKHLINTNLDYKDAFRELLNDKLAMNNPEGLAQLLRLTQETDDIDMAKKAYAWAYPDHLSEEFLKIHLLPLPLISIGVAAADLFDDTQHGYGFYVELMEKTPALPVYKRCMKPLARRDLEVFRETVARTMYKFDGKNISAVKRRKTECINDVIRAQR